MFSVMLVDDEPWALYGIRNSFKWDELGFEVIAEVTTSIKALELIKDLRPDVVFTDIRMPDMSGIELMIAVNDIGIDSEFVIVSGFAEFEYAKNAIKYGAFYYLLKPIDIKEGIEVIKKLAERLKEKKSYSALLNQSPENITQEGINQSFKELLLYVNSNYQNDLKLGGLSDKFHINLTYICDLFKKVTYKTFSSYITELRMNRACDLLKSTELLVSQIAESVGYDTYYFNILFKKIYNTTPLKYRKGE